MASFTRKRGDQLTEIIDYLKDGDGNALPLEAVDVSKVLCLISLEGDTSSTVKGVGSIEDSATAKVKYITSSTDFAKKGHYLQEWEVTYTSGQVATIPSMGYNEIFIEQDLNP